MDNIKVTKKTARCLLEIFDYMQRGVFDSAWHEEQEVVDELKPQLEKFLRKQEAIEKLNGVTQ